MTTYTRQFSPASTANARSADGKSYLVAERGTSFRWPYAGWNRDGKDVCKADDLAGALAAFGLVAYTAPVVPKRLVERSPLYVRRALRALGKESAYDALLAGLPAQAKADYEDAVAFAWDDPLLVGMRSVASLALGMTEAELRAIFEE